MIIFSKFVALGSYMCPNCKYAVNTDKKNVIVRCPNCRKLVVIEGGIVKGWR